MLALAVLLPTPDASTVDTELAVPSAEAFVAPPGTFTIEATSDTTGDPPVTIRYEPPTASVVTTTSAPVVEPVTTVPLPPSTVGGPPVRITVFGDSVADSLARSLAPDAARFNTVVTNAAIVGCGVPDIGPYVLGGTEHDVAPECEGWQAIWDQRLADERPEVALIVLGRHEVLDRQYDGVWTAIGDPSYDGYLVSQLRIAIDLARQHGVQPVLTTAPFYVGPADPGGGIRPENTPRVAPLQPDRPGRRRRGPGPRRGRPRRDREPGRLVRGDHRGHPHPQRRRPLRTRGGALARAGFSPRSSTRCDEAPNPTAARRRDDRGPRARCPDASIPTAGPTRSTGTPITTTTAVWAPATTVAETSPPVPTTWAPGSDPSSGCASDQPRAEADSTTTVEVDGVERSSRYLAPTRPSPGRPDPVIMLLHGKGSDGATVLDYSQMSSAADQLGAGIVLPEAIGGDHRWTELDVPFLRTVLDQLGAERCIDRNRIWLAGLSMGGFTSARLACDLPGRFAAVAAVAGFGFDAATCPSAPPTPVLTFHGTGDDVIPFAGRPPGS